MAVTLVVGTIKGAFLLRSDESRTDWSLKGPLFKGWKVTAVHRTGQGHYLLATASDVYGAGLHRGPRLDEWTPVSQGPAYPEDGGFKLNQIWTLAEGGARLYAGVDEAGLFSSDDGGDTWQIVEGLTSHPTRPSWFPGFGGLCCHSVLVDAAKPERIWVGISAVGVFRSEDGGRSFQPRNEGVPVIIEDKTHKDIGFCVHAITADPAEPDTIYRQDHLGMFRTRDGGDQWQRVEEGLPSRFGFPLARDPASGALFACPLESDEYRIPLDGKLKVYRSTDGADSWQDASKGLPQSFYAGVLRKAVAVDGMSPGGVYVGTTAGTVHVSNDAGESWQNLPFTLPRVLTVACFREPK